MLEATDILKKYWGYGSFRPLQADVIASVLSGNDTFALMPTGGGKSLCFQVPSLMQKGLCLVISPLLALMKDQVLNLKVRGIPALEIHGGMGYAEVKKNLQNAAYGNFKFLYVSPERLQTELFLEFVRLININLIAVDEAHCISQWGYDFRPSYLHIADLRELLPMVPVLALTASATPLVQKDICEKLLFGDTQQSFRQPFARPNLSYSAFRPVSKESKLLDIVNNVPGSGIVYCKTRRRALQVAGMLKKSGISADHYHAGLSTEERHRKQDAWMKDKIRIIACTNAFGMGIDKSNVRTVIHFDVPDAIESYYQEAGRAGRDGRKAYAVLLYTERELELLKKQVETRFPDNAMIKKVYGDLCNYLQLPANSGEGLSFDFDFKRFTENFQLSTSLTGSVVKILEQEELLRYSDHFFQPASVEFRVGKEELTEFTGSHSRYNDLLDALLRSYNGIFDAASFINEEDLAKRTGVDKKRVLGALSDLNAAGVIRYIPRKEKPQLYFVKNRVKTDELFINQQNVLKRKKAYRNRLEAMIRFCRSEAECRSAQIGYYFTGTQSPACGKCDNCLRRRNSGI